MQADLEKLIQVNQTLWRLQVAAHRTLLFSQDSFAKYQAGDRQLKVQNADLQQAVVTFDCGRCMHNYTSLHLAPP